MSERTAAKWLARWRAEGEAGLLDRSSAPRARPTQPPDGPSQGDRGAARLRMTAAEIAERLGLAPPRSPGGFTSSAWGSSAGSTRRSLPTAMSEAARRVDSRRRQEVGQDQHQGRGTPDHRDAGPSSVKLTEGGRQRRGTGWEFVHVCVDDATRLAYAEVLPDERGATAAAFLRRAVAWLASMGVGVERVMSDNGSCYISNAHAEACRELGLRHLRTRPYRPQTNGKAERFIQTLARRWAYGAIYGSSSERTAALSGWLSHYNFTRRHGSLGHRPPAARLVELEQRHG